MKVLRLHSWLLTPKEAVALQRQLADRAAHGPTLRHADLIAGADVSYNRFSNIFYAGVVVLRTSNWAVVEKQGVVRRVHFPYVPGLLSFREAPAMIAAFAKLRTEPDVVIVDGHGFSHPRRIGLAAHVGICLDRPTVGCAKTLLVGTYREPAAGSGSQTALKHGGEIIGKVLRTRTGVKPVFVSVGNRIDLASAVRWVLRSSGGYRIPEPIRQAHQFVNELRRAGGRIENL
jgi:deoxyribonuclease V